MENSKQWDSNKYAQDLIRRKARQLVGKYGFTTFDREDLEQELFLRLYECLPQFDCRKACLATFMSRVITHEISSMIRHRKQKKRDYRRPIYSLDESMPHEDGQAIARVEMVNQDKCDLSTGNCNRSEEERRDLYLDVSRVISQLPPDLQPLAERLMTHTITEVARERGLPRSTLYDREISQLRQFFEDKGLKKYL